MIVVPARQAGNQLLGSLKGLKIKALLSQGWGDGWESKPGPALQQAGALTSEQRRSLYVYYRTINAVVKKIRLFQTTYDVLFNPFRVHTISSRIFKNTCYTKTTRFCPDSANLMRGLPDLKLKIFSYFE